MSGNTSPVASISALLQSVQAQTDAVQNFKDEQINFFTSTASTTTITDADGNATAVATWSALQAQISAIAAAEGTGITSIAGLTTRVITASDLITALALATVATTGDYNSLQNLPAIPAAQINSDWNATSGVAQILNKPDLSLKEDIYQAFNNQTGTTYTLAATDFPGGTRHTNAAAITVTIDTNANVNIPRFAKAVIRQGGAGVVTIVGATGVTLKAPNGASTNADGDFRTIEQTDIDVWVVG